jgi:leucine dehydrogenase
MQVIKSMDDYGHEQIVYCRDDDVGLRAIIAVHSTALGPALGGARFYDYASEYDALYDVLRLSKGMTLKNAAAGLPLGGGKSVILGDPAKLKSKAFFHAFGRYVNMLAGTYYTAEDMNMGTADIAAVNEATRFVAGTPAYSGNPSPFTARGVFKGMKAGALELFGSDSLEGKTVAVQGIGSVGYNLLRHLHGEGALLKVNDVNSAAVEKAIAEFGAVAVTNQELLTTDCDIFAPCAMGAVLNVDNVKGLKCRLIAGAANNVLVDAAAGEALDTLGILYLPDYIVNAGGVINCGIEVLGGEYSHEIVNTRVDKIYGTTTKIIALAKEKKISTSRAADEYALGVVAAAKAGK